jgi:hypothetical protein
MSSHNRDDDASAHIEKLIATIAEQQARIEALEAALQSIVALDHEDWEMDVKMRVIASAALDKDAT